MKLATLLIFISSFTYSQTYKGIPVQFEGDRWNITATMNKEISEAEAKEFFKFLRKEVKPGIFKDRYVIGKNIIYYQPGLLVFKKHELQVIKRRCKV